MQSRNIPEHGSLSCINSMHINHGSRLSLTSGKVLVGFDLFKKPAAQSSRQPIRSQHCSGECNRGNMTKLVYMPYDSPVIKRC